MDDSIDVFLNVFIDELMLAIDFWDVESPSVVHNGGHLSDSDFLQLLGFPDMDALEGYVGMYFDFPSNNPEPRQLQGQNLEDFVNSTFDDTVSGNLSPAAKFVVEGLTEVVIPKGNDEVCAICSEEIAEGEKVNMLPCWHYYHGDCINPWVRMKNSCPVCRFELPSDEDIEGYMRNKKRRRTEDNSDLRHS